MNVLLRVPFFHLQVARHVNFAASGILRRASRASSRAPTFTPLFTAAAMTISLLECDQVVLRISLWIIAPARRQCLSSPSRILRRMAARANNDAAAGSVGTVETRFFDLPRPLTLDCG